MKNIMFCGSRKFENFTENELKEKFLEIVENEIDFELDNDEDFKIIHGGCSKGIDSIVEDWTDENDLNEEIYRPEDESIKKDYLERNDEMIDDADKIIAIWNGHSNGTKYVIDNSPNEKLIVYNLSSTLFDYFEK